MLPPCGRSPLDDLTTFTFYSPRCSEAGSFRISATDFKISRESDSSDTARARAIAPASALKVKIAFDLATRLSLSGSNPAIELTVVPDLFGGERAGPLYEARSAVPCSRRIRGRPNNADTRGNLSPAF
jgi:hypothetical protein